MKKDRKENSLASRHPELVAEWHPTLNGDKTPYNISYGSTYKATWILHYDDPETGKHFDFVWEAYVYKRSAGEKCPYLAGKKIWPGFNDLASRCPNLVAEWHPTLNGDKTPYNVTFGSGYRATWILPYDDPETGKHFDFVWEAYVYHRSAGEQCPYLTGKKVWPGFNDLETKCLELAEQFHPTKNGLLTASDVTAYSNNEDIWWIYPYDDPETGIHYDFSWPSRITNRVQDNSGCPYLSNNAVWEGYNDLQFKRPDLAEEWDYEKNGRVTPNKITLCSGPKRWWKCKRCGKPMYISPAKRAAGQNCSCYSEER